MGRGDAAATAKGTPRIRNKITHKTRLRVVHGDVVDSDRAFADDDQGDGKALATGVDAEDANEYHLLAVLAASQQSTSSSTAFCQQTPSSSSRNANNKNNLAPPAPAQSTLYIPTPDATGKVANYANFYPDIQWEPPILLAKASDTVEESQAEVLGGGYAYVLDERDADWLERSNKAANGEGTSANGALGTPRSRSAKARGKEPESTPPVVISEDDFELAMGLFERITDEKFPYLHLTPSDVPLLSDYETFFSNPLPPHYFPSYVVPPIVPPPALLSRYARFVYPHWRERKIERGGRRIIPQLNYDESNDSDPYVCFRRREVKPLRKTRRQDTTSLDRLLKLQDELHKVLAVSKMVLAREMAKVEVSNEMRGVSEKRVKLVECKKKGGPMLIQINDDELFVDKSAIKRRDKGDGSSNTIRLRPPRATYDSNGQAGFSAHPGLASADLHQNALAKIAGLQERVEKEVAKRKDPHWEDVTENAYQPLSAPLPHKHFRTVSITMGDSNEKSGLFSFSSGSSPSSASSSSAPSSSAPSRGQRTGRSAMAMRMRVGRGGRMMVDRRLPSVRHPLDFPSPSPGSKAGDLGLAFLSKPSAYSPTPSDASSSGSRAISEEDTERAWRIEERWRYDSDAGLPIGGAGLGDSIGEPEDTRLIVDDYEHNTFVIRKNLLNEDDFSTLLRTDDSHLTRVVETRQDRKEEELKRVQNAIQVAAEVRREMAARAPPPPAPPTTPSVAIPPVAQVAVPVSAAANGNAAMVGQMKKVARQQQIAQGQLMPSTRPHPLAMSSTPVSQSSQISPTSASAASSGGGPGPSPNLANGLPVATPGINGVNNGINGKPTPPLSQTSFPAHLQPPNSNQLSRQSQSPNMHDMNGMAPPSPEARPKSQPQPQANGMPVPMSIPQQNVGGGGGPGYIQSNGMMPNFPNGFNVGMPIGTPSIPIQMQMRANGIAPNGQMMMNGTAGMNMNTNTLTSLQAMSLKSAFASATQQQQMNGLQQQNHPLFPVNGLVGMNGNGNVVNGMPMNGQGGSPQNVQNLNLAIGNGNISLKLPAQRAMQWAAANSKDGGNAMHGTPSPQQQRQQQSSSPIPPSMSPANGQRLVRGSPHLQAAAITGRASPGNMNGMMGHHATSPSPRITPQMPHAPSPLASHQQTVGGPGQGHMNGY